MLDEDFTTATTSIARTNIRCGKIVNRKMYYTRLPTAAKLVQNVMHR